MRQIDNMTEKEIDVLKLKGMLPERTAPARAQHSPLPWTVETLGIVTARNGEQVIARTYEPQVNASEVEANAAYIVRACNSKPAADSMADALEEYLDYASPENYSNAKAALAAWEKAQQ